MQSVSDTVNVPIEDALAGETPHHTSDTTMDVTETSIKILDIIFEYALHKLGDSMQQLAAGRPKFLSVIAQFVTAQKQVEMCLPAFPFKSANKVDKVFGILPDKAEELALERLNTMCIRIGRLYSPGAKLTIISDGLVYNGRSNIDPIIFPHLISPLILLSCIDRLVGYIGS